jgi:hypothetical protein
MYAEAGPLSQVLDSIPAMPDGYDLGALIEELEKLKVSRVEIRDHVAMLVPAEAQVTRPAHRLSRSTLSASLPNELADRVRAAAMAAGVSVSAIITSAVAEFLDTSIGNV